MAHVKRYAIVFSSDMQHPLYIVAASLEEFWYQLREIMMKYGEVELIYRVY